MYGDDDFEGEQDQIINEEYKIWKYNSPYLYDTLLMGAIEWPSLTVSWLPHREITNDGLFTVHRFILGTHTNNNEQNYLIIAKAYLPTQQSSSQGDDDLHYTQEQINAYSKIESKIEIEYKINHTGEINKARPMPQHDKSNIIATKTQSGEIHIFDYLKHPGKPTDMQTKPELKLTGHTKEGFGLCWSALKEGFLLSGSDDHRICLWDINVCNGCNPLMKTIEKHKSVVEDVSWSKQLRNVFVSCGDDHKMMIWDIRKDEPTHIVEAHVQEVNSVDCNPFNEYLILTSSNDKTCALWDIRNLNKKLHVFKNHKNDVIAARWNPRIMSLFASFSSDRRVNIWDLSQIGLTVPELDEDGPSELLFTHGGHTSRISDMDWNPNEELMCISVSDDNIVQVWEMAGYLYYNDSGNGHSCYDDVIM